MRALAREGTTRPREGGSQYFPLAESGIGGNDLAGVTECWCVERAQDSRGAEEGRVARGRAGADPDILEPECFQRSFWTSPPLSSKINVQRCTRGS